MIWLAMLVHWLHVFFAIFWFGGTLFMFAIGMPALEQSSPAAAAEVGNNLGVRMARVLAPVGGLTILFGLINAIGFGPVRSLEFLWTSAYGITFAIAVILAIALAILGALTGKVGASIPTASDAVRPILLNRIVRLAGMSVFGFGLVLVCMVLMRYGL